MWRQKTCKIFELHCYLYLFLQEKRAIDVKLSKIALILKGRDGKIVILAAQTALASRAALVGMGELYTCNCIIVTRRVYGKI